MYINIILNAEEEKKWETDDTLWRELNRFAETASRCVDKTETNVLVKNDEGHQLYYVRYCRM